MRERIKQLKKISQKGFTLIELMAVLAILAILLAIAIPAIGKVIDKSDASSDKSSIELIERAGEKAHVEKTPFDEPSGDMPEESYTIPTLIDEGYLDLDEDSKFNSPDHYVVKENNQNDRNPNNDDDTTTPNKSGNFVYVGVGAPGNPGPGDGGTGGEPGPAVGPSTGFTPVTVAPDGCIEITDAAGLDAIRDNLDGCYVVMEPIDLSGYANWMSIGLYYDSAMASFRQKPFTGSFDGQRYPITGLAINKPTQRWLGLFAYASDAEFKNVALDGVNVTGGNYTAGLIGNAELVSISDSYVTGSVTSIDGSAQTSLLVADLYEGSITNSYTDGTVSGDYGVGGLAGEIYDASITNSYSTASVEGASNVGGLVSSAYEWGGVVNTITNSHATGAVTGVGGGTAYYGGGLIGQSDGYNITDSHATGNVSNFSNAGGFIGNMGGYDETISNSYATGDVIGVAGGASGGFIGYGQLVTIANSYSLGNVTGVATGTTGGFIGYGYDINMDKVYSAGTVTGAGTLQGFVGELLYEVSTPPTNAYYNSDGGITDATGATPKTSAELKQQATFAGFDFVETWKSDGSNYPTLK